ncbi:hypothetical protein LIS77_22850 [Cytobacillus firmus]|uniref:hypothetical protein n=1 Tax=Cytobacillus firmus TaxID=1399 RepID=UPI0020792FFD|nr:hypothetical protein [Cytobacillus firmus]USK38690.1 hypothetical protein LIS77_22850 [Cytobacillus firmus]
MKKFFSPKIFFYISVFYLFLYELVLLKIDEIIPGISASLGRITNTLAAGYIPSYLVYYLTVEAPRKKELVIAEKQIGDLKNYIVQDFSNIIAELNFCSNEELQKKIKNPQVDSFNPVSTNYSKIEGKLQLPMKTKDFIYKSSKLIYPQKETFTAEIITTLESDGSSIEIKKIPWLIYLQKMVDSIRNHIDEMLTFTNYLTIEELIHLQKIKNSDFAVYITNFEKSFQNMKVSNRKSWDEDFPDYLWEYYNFLRIMNGEEELDK